MSAWFLRLLDLLLLSISGFYAFKSVNKYLDGKIAVNTDMVEDKFAREPSFTVCSGFKCSGTLLDRLMLNTTGSGTDPYP